MRPTIVSLCDSNRYGNSFSFDPLDCCCSILLEDERQRNDGFVLDIIFGAGGFAYSGRVKDIENL